MGRPADHRTPTAASSATCPRSAASTPSSRSLDQLVYLGRLRGMRPRPPAPRSLSHLERSRPRRPRQRPRREALASATSSGCRSSRPCWARPGGPRARRAVQRPRPAAVDAMADLLREHAASGRAGALLLPPARPRRAALRAPRRAGPRAGRRHGRARRPALDVGGAPPAPVLSVPTPAGCATCAVCTCTTSTGRARCSRSLDRRRRAGPAERGAAHAARCASSLRSRPPWPRSTVR